MARNNLTGMVTKLIPQALIVLVVGGGISWVLGGVIANAGASSAIVGGIITVVLAVLVAWLFTMTSRKDLPMNFVNLVVLFGVAAGLAVIIGGMFPAAAPFLLGLGGQLTFPSLVALLFYSALGVWAVNRFS